jgi:hypothetical protein
LKTASENRIVSGFTQTFKNLIRLHPLEPVILCGVCDREHLMKTFLVSSMSFFLLFTVFSCNWFGSGKSRRKEASQTAPALPPEPELTATPGWKTETDGFTLVSGTGGDWVHAVGYTGNINQWRPADQYLMSAADGSVRWKKRRTMKSYGENAPWALRLHLWDSRTFFYETRYKAVYSLSLADGSTERIIANAFHFAPCGKELFVGAGKKEHTRGRHETRIRRGGRADGAPIPGHGSGQRSRGVPIHRWSPASGFLLAAQGNLAFHGCYGPQGVVYGSAGFRECNTCLYAHAVVFAAHIYPRHHRRG